MAHKHHGMLPFNGIEHLCNFGQFQPGRFARLFTDLPPLYIDPRVLHEVGKVGGVMDDGGNTPLTASVPAGMIFFGQFVDHDITLDDSSSLTAVNNAEGTENVRTPTLDLDCVYGDGPGAHPYLYDKRLPDLTEPERDSKLLTGADYASDPSDLKVHDLPRTPKGTAIIGDPRNDENRIISQMQLGFLRLHNKVVDQLVASGTPGDLVFEEARRCVTWHYQWIVVNDFLRTICGNWIVDDILANGRKVYCPELLDVNKGKQPFIPIEFATAAFRFGHTLIPQKFRLKPNQRQRTVFEFAPFSPVASTDEVVDWAVLLDSGNGEFERAGRVDTKLASALLDLPFVISDRAFEKSLAVRNLLRAQSFLIPSGEQIAEAMVAAGANEISADMIATVRAAGKSLGLPKATPFWLYILAEGRAIGRMDMDPQGEKVFAKGEGLGPVGARFVAEVIIGLLELDSRSFMGSNRNWSPLDSGDKIGNNGVSTLYQFLTAGMV